MTTYNTPILPVCCVSSGKFNLYPRCILGHKIGGFRASEGLSKKHECLSQEYFIMQIMDIKIKKLLLTLQKQTIGCMQSKKIVCFPSKINERKKHWC